MFIELLRVYTIGSFGVQLVSNSKEPIKSLSLNKYQCQARSTLVHIHSNETLFYPFAISIIKRGGSCNTINDMYLHLPDISLVLTYTSKQGAHLKLIHVVHVDA